MDGVAGRRIAMFAKVCLVVIFPFSGLDKVLNWGNALKQAELSFLPGGAVLLVLAMMVEFITPSASSRAGTMDLRHSFSPVIA